MQITYQLINSLKTEKSGWTKDSLKYLGVDWPPVKGWKERIIGGHTQGKIKTTYNLTTE